MIESVIPGKKAVLLLSGGLDSQIALQLALHEGFDVHAISFDYGQRHHKELNAARAIAAAAHVPHQIVSLNLNEWGGSSLTDVSIPIEKGDVHKEHIPNTYVPARNMIFIALAASYAEVIQAQTIIIGVSEVDYSGYVDCRQDFLSAMENAINMGTVAAVEHGRKFSIYAPFIHQTKTEEIKLGQQLQVDFGLSWSCYQGGEKPCGICDSCLLRIQAFKNAGVIDPSYTTLL